MPQDALESSSFSPDVLDFIVLLHKHSVEYTVVGGEAVIYYGYARLTGDIDIFYACTKENARRMFAALSEFWEGDIPGLAGFNELTQEGLIVQFGRPPHRIDLVNRIDGVSFEEAWATRTVAQVQTERGKVPLHYLSLDLLIRNKEAVGRPKDIEDLQYLHRAGRPRESD